MKKVAPAIVALFMLVGCGESAEDDWQPSETGVVVDYHTFERGDTVLPLGAEDPVPGTEMLITIDYGTGYFDPSTIEFCQHRFQHEPDSNYECELLAHGAEDDLEGAVKYRVTLEEPVTDYRLIRSPTDNVFERPEGGYVEVEVVYPTIRDIRVTYEAYR